MQAFDLAVGNLFGSNALNMAMFVPLDLAHSDVPILTVVGSTHALSALISIVLMGTALAALVYRSKRRLAMLEPGSAVMVIIYFAGLFLIYLQSVAQGGM